MKKLIKIKDMEYTRLLLAFIYHRNVIPYCLSFTKSHQKSIDRYWHRINHIKRGKNEWKKFDSCMELEEVLKRL